MSKKTFELHSDFSEALSKSQFEIAKEKYLKEIEKNQYAIREANSIFELIENTKRSPETIGPYKDISFFEAINRIASDFVLLSGATMLFEGKIAEIKPERILLRLGNAKGYDFEVTLADGSTIMGEAFNAAPSFCKTKLNQAISKFATLKRFPKSIQSQPDKIDTSRGIVFMNESVQDICTKHLQRKNSDPDFKLHEVYCRNMEQLYSPV